MVRKECTLPWNVSTHLLSLIQIKIQEDQIISISGDVLVATDREQGEVILNSMFLDNVVI